MYKSHIRNVKQRSGNNKAKHRETIEPDEGQQYGVVRDMLGNGRLRAMCENGTEIIARIRGSMRKYKSKVIISPGDLVVIAMREYEADKADIIHKYTHEEVSDLIYLRALPEKIMKAITESEMGGAGGGGGGGEEYVMFHDDADDAGDFDIGAI